MCHMIIEQTYDYKKRMGYSSVSNTFYETTYDSLLYVRNFKYPYGWIAESGTPPDAHWDVILMSDKHYTLGDIISVKIIGIFIRNDGDHKFIAANIDRGISDYSQLSDDEKHALHRLYPDIDEGGGWFGKEKALNILLCYPKPKK